MCRRCRSICCRPGGGPSARPAAACSVSSSLSRPPSASICFFSSSVRYFSASFFSHSAGISAWQRVADGFEPLEHVAEHAVELVEVALVLHQRGARQIIKILDPAGGEIGLHGLHQVKIFPQSHRNSGAFEFLKEGDEHEASICLWPGLRQAGTKGPSVGDFYACSTATAPAGRWPPFFPLPS